MADLKMIEDLTNAFGPSGFEEDVVRAIKLTAERFALNMTPCIMYMHLWTSRREKLSAGGELRQGGEGGDLF